jgi:fluoride exporter
VRLLIQIVLVSVGGSLGALLRWGVGVVAGRWLGTAYPWGTFIINISGSLFLGWFMTLLTDRLPHTEGLWLSPNDLRLMIAVGFTGAYTTFSTFEYESNGLLRDGDGLLGITYIFASVFLGLVAVRIGIFLARGNG